MNACETLFDKGGYTNVNLKMISEMTAVTRPAIYNYYKTKDEIILDLLQKELLAWHNELKNWVEKNSPMSKKEFCSRFAENIATKKRMLSYYSLLFTNLEQNCRLEKIENFKQNIFPLLETIKKIIQTNFPEYSQNAEKIMHRFIAYILGLYPMTHLTDKQKEAMRLAHIDFNILDFKTMCEQGLYALLQN